MSKVALESKQALKVKGKASVQRTLLSTIKPVFLTTEVT